MDFNRGDKVALTQDYEHVKQGATGIVTHLNGDPLDHPGEPKYKGLPGDVWVDFGANGGEIWVEFVDLEKL